MRGLVAAGSALRPRRIGGSDNRHSCRRGQQHDAADLGDGRGWPMLRRQQELLAQLLVSQGWGALQPWLVHPGQHPGERSQPKTNQSGSDPIAALFDEAA
jgi:hypothetical protein